MDWLLPLFGGLGIGSLVTKIIDHFLINKAAKENKFYQEKREVYLGLLDSLHRAAVSPSLDSSKAFALWQTKVELFGSPAVSEAAQGIVETNDGPIEARQKYFRSLVDEMKKDLRS